MVWQKYFHRSPRNRMLEATNVEDTLTKHWLSVVSDKMDNFSYCSVILHLSHKGSTLKEVKEDMMVTAGEITTLYKAWWNGRLLSRNVTRRFWKLSWKSSHHYHYIRDHCQGSCSSIVDGRVQIITLLQGVCLLGPYASWTWSKMDSAQLLKGEWQLSFLWQFVTTDVTWFHHFQPELFRAVERFSVFQES